MAISGRGEGSDLSPRAEDPSLKEVNGPTFKHDEIFGSAQRPQDRVDEAVMGSFPCSDPPSYNCCRI